VLKLFSDERKSHKSELSTVISEVGNKRAVFKPYAVYFVLTLICSIDMGHPSGLVACGDYNFWMTRKI
jgi:hypothetical protein